ncbi:uroporphyrinogen-III C-methyltransferase [Arhodomonas sp. KWT2]|uniref:uroporphyrinogen-III C-methyltransferase n=1 Tax=unclassified Arhodomonas TaxID=2621637 RepID=UPI001F08C53A|nr:uroporphyrinogen-III C-methyltransferase [Arhodomonas sp. KWT]
MTPYRPVPEGGCVSLVGCGPGDPDLLTIRAARTLAAADVIVHDRLIDHRILAMAPEHARVIDAGKRCARHTLAQPAICALLVEHARAGRHVVRLKGGDPFVFGRGGEELAACRAAGVPCEVVPGVTAALGCAAATGIPLTQRGRASAVTFITGHGRDGDLPAQDWRALAGPGRTLVCYMATRQWPRLRRALLDAGLGRGLPVAVIHGGTRADQSVYRTTLADGLPPVRDERPALVIVGEVAAEAACDVPLPPAVAAALP